MNKTARIALIALIAAGAAACVSMPDFDNVEGTPEEFKTELANIDGYPDSTSIPRTPTDVPSAAEFDSRARALLARSDTFAIVDGLTTPTLSDMIDARRQLLAQVNAYKLDDPK